MSSYSSCFFDVQKLEAVTALAFQSETLIVGFEDGQVKILRQGRDALMAKPFHSSTVQELRILSEDLFLSSGQVALCYN